MVLGNKQQIKNYKYPLYQSNVHILLLSILKNHHTLGVKHLYIFSNITIP